MRPRDIAQEILDQHGTWTVSQQGADGLHDAIWDAFPAHQRMTPEEQAKVEAKVREAIFG